MSLDKFIPDENSYVPDNIMNEFIYEWLIYHNFSFNKYMINHIERQVYKLLPYDKYHTLDKDALRSVINIHMICLLPSVFEYFYNIESQSSQIDINNIPDCLYRDYLINKLIPRNDE